MKGKFLLKLVKKEGKKEIEEYKKKFGKKFLPVFEMGLIKGTNIASEVIFRECMLIKKPETMKELA